MHMQKSLMAVGLAALLSTVMAPYPATAKDLIIGVSFDKIEPFRVAEQKALDEAIAAQKAKQSFANADKDAQRQASQVETMVSQGVSAIVAIPWDIEAANDLARTTIAAGIPFVSLDQAPSDLKSVTYHVGGDPCADGKVAGDQVTFHVLAEEQAGNQINDSRLKFTGVLRDGSLEITREREGSTNAGNGGAVRTQGNPTTTFRLKKLL